MLFPLIPLAPLPQSRCKLLLPQYECEWDCVRVRLRSGGNLFLSSLWALVSTHTHAAMAIRLDSGSSIEKQYTVKMAREENRS